MKVKELLKKLRGQYTEVLPFNEKHKDAIPYTLLGADLHALLCDKKAFNKALGEKELTGYKLEKPQRVISCSLSSGEKSFKYDTTLIVYFK